MATFETSFAKTSVHEGMYANNSLDRGGETYRGISRKFWPGWKGWKEVDLLRAQGKTGNAIRSKKLDGLVDDFYKDNFWRPLGCDGIQSQIIADEMFDTGVNMGVKQAVRFLQEALVISGLNISIDGRIGPKTLAATNGADTEILLRLLNILQGEKYLQIVRADPSQRLFLRGWLRRADSDVKSK